MDEVFVPDACLDVTQSAANLAHSQAAIHKGGLAKQQRPYSLADCAREPIHTPGTIQPHGVLFVLSRDDLRITAVSANVAEHLGRPPHDLLDVPLVQLLDGASFKAVADAADLSADDGPAWLARVSLPGLSGQSWRALVQATVDGILLEAELLQPQADIDTADLFDRFDRASRRVQAVSDEVTVCKRLAEEVRRLTGYARVKVYRFAPDWSGEVIAEDSSGELPSYLGLHFPASDIPSQARALYVRNTERQIPDVLYTPVPLIQVRPAPIDLSHSALRSVSPVHIEYLRNMEVGASMSISILRHGALWGLVACHHGTAHYVAPELRQASVLLAQLVAWQLAQAEEAETVRRSIGVAAIKAHLVQDAVMGRDYREALSRTSDGLLGLPQASGLALSYGGSVTCFGDTLSDPDLGSLIEWLSHRGPDLFETDHLAAHYPPASCLSNAAGIVAVPMGLDPKNLMIWFRCEIARTVTWAGDQKKAIVMVAGEDRLNPHRSFETWTEQVHGRSRTWARHEVAAANGLRDMIVDLRRSADLAQMNSQLLRSNEELEAFAYVASHDLKEPLRQIETFGTLLERVFRDRAPPGKDVGRWFEGIQSSCRRLRTLISDLAEYSRIGRQTHVLMPVDFNEMLESVKTDLASVIEDSHATIVAGPLPVVMCDPAQMRQVMQNVVSNALKYRSAARPPVVTITATSSTAVASDMPVLELSIADNGIGFEERHQEQIFEAFQRLHSSDEFEGSGIGLAICRTIVKRHHGTITATSQPGEGSTFTITLPQRQLPESSQ